MSGVLNIEVGVSKVSANFRQTSSTRNTYLYIQYVDMTDSKPPMTHFDDVFLKSKGEGIIDEWGEFGSMDAIEDDLFLFVIEAHGAIEEYTTRAICQQIIKDSYSDDAFEYVYSDMSQYHREKLLSQCGVLEDTLPNDLDKFRGLRNQIAHNRGRGLDWEDDNIEEIIRDAIEVLLELRSVVVGSNS